eukprot:4367207-Amphidinium_carterae.1
MVLVVGSVFRASAQGHQSIADTAKAPPHGNRVHQILPAEIATIVIHCVSYLFLPSFLEHSTS